MDKEVAMEAKEYLYQAYRLDQRIHAKMEQAASLRDLAERVASVTAGAPMGRGSSGSAMADAADRIVGLQAEISGDIDRLIRLKREIAEAIRRVAKPEHQTLLELRYLCFKTWEQIAQEMKYSRRSVYRMHDAAAREIQVPKGWRG